MVLLGVIFFNLLVISNVQAAPGVPLLPITEDRALDLLSTIDRRIRDDPLGDEKLRTVFKFIFREQGAMIRNWTVLEETCMKPYTNNHLEQNVFQSCGILYPSNPSPDSIQKVFECFVPLSHGLPSSRTSVLTALGLLSSNKPCQHILLDWASIVDACQIAYDRGARVVAHTSDSHDIYITSTRAITACIAFGVPNMVPQLGTSAMRLLRRAFTWQRSHPRELIAASFERFDYVMKNWVALEEICMSEYQSHDPQRWLVGSCGSFYPLQDPSANIVQEAFECLTHAGGNMHPSQDLDLVTGLQMISNDALQDWSAIVDACQLLYSPDMSNNFFAILLCQTLVVPNFVFDLRISAIRLLRRTMIWVPTEAGSNHLVGAFKRFGYVMRNWTTLEEVCVEEYRRSDRQPWLSISCASFYPIQETSIQKSFNCLAQVGSDLPASTQLDEVTGIAMILHSDCGEILHDWSTIVDACQLFYRRNLPEEFQYGLPMCKALNVPNIRANMRTSAIRLLRRALIWQMEKSIEDILIGAFERFGYVMKNWVELESFCSSREAVEQQLHIACQLFIHPEATLAIPPDTITNCLKEVGEISLWMKDRMNAHAAIQYFVDTEGCKGILKNWKAVVQACQKAYSGKVEKDDPVKTFCSVLGIPKLRKNGK